MASDWGDMASDWGDMIPITAVPAARRGMGIMVWTPKLPKLSAVCNSVKQETCMSGIPPTPLQERFPKLEEYLCAFAAEITPIWRGHPELLTPRPSHILLLLTLPWILELEVPDIGIELRSLIDRRKTEIQALGFSGEQIATRLQEIHQADAHLSECCPTIVHLAIHISRNFVYEAIQLLEARSESLLDGLFKQFSSLTYEQGRFRRSAFTHIVNLEMPERDTDFGGVRVIRLNPDFIQKIVGEPGNRTFLHPPGIGCAFVYVNEGPTKEKDDDWLRRKHIEAEWFVRILQYFKDGVIHAGYTTASFFPDWVNEVRREGIFFLGKPRRLAYEEGGQLYSLSKEEIADVADYLKVMRLPHISAMLEDRGSVLRQCILRAGDYYEKSHTEESRPEMLVDLAIALEALFSPTDKGELRFRVAQMAAQLAGDSLSARENIFAEVKRFYDRRSKLVHGDYDTKKYYDGTFITHDEIQAWSSIVRRATLAFLILAFRGKKTRAELHELLEKAAFDESVGAELRSASETKQFIREELNKIAATP
jgi:hypothetical protein